MRENPAAFTEKSVPDVPATRLARKDSPICAKDLPGHSAMLAQLLHLGSCYLKHLSNEK